MIIEATAQNRWTINKAQTALSNAHRAAKDANYNYLLADIRKLKGMLLVGKIDDQHLADLKSYIRATRHERQAKKIRKHAADAFDLIAAAL